MPYSELLRTKGSLDIHKKEQGKDHFSGMITGPRATKARVWAWNNTRPLFRRAVFLPSAPQGTTNLKKIAPF